MRQFHMFTLPHAAFNIAFCDLSFADIAKEEPCPVELLDSAAKVPGFEMHPI